MHHFIVANNQHKLIGAKRLFKKAVKLNQSLLLQIAECITMYHSHFDYLTMFRHHNAESAKPFLSRHYH